MGLGLSSRLVLVFDAGKTRTIGNHSGYALRNSYSSECSVRRGSAVGFRVSPSSFAICRTRVSVMPRNLPIALLFCLPKSCSTTARRRSDSARARMPRIARSSCVSNAFAPSCDTTVAGSSIVSNRCFLSHSRRMARHPLLMGVWPAMRVPPLQMGHLTSRRTRRQQPRRLARLQRTQSAGSVRTP